MLKYAIVEELEDHKSKKFLSPWLLKGASVYKHVSQVPKDHIIVSSRQNWVEPMKSWSLNGGKYIEIEYGYWGERLPENKPRIQTKRVTYCASHNSNMKSNVPYSRLKTLSNPQIQPWNSSRGEYLLLIEPKPEWIELRTGMNIIQWKEHLYNIIKPFWDGPVRWRSKRGGASKSRFDTFINDLKGCHAVVGERTMACVEAVMLGYPAYTIDNTAVTPLMGKDLSMLKNPLLPDRAKWFEHIAWSQFHNDEFIAGTKVADMVEQYQIY